jgi:hypothetical protein
MIFHCCFALHFIGYNCNLTYLKKIFISHLYIFFHELFLEVSFPNKIFFGILNHI